MSFYSEASLVMIPSGVKEGKVYSAKPVDGTGDLTFSRGSDIEATRVNANGYIEKAQVNLLLQSNQFDTTWTASNATLTSGQSGYDGTTDAWKLEASAAGGNLFQYNATSGVIAFSAYAKAGNVNWIRLRFDNVSSSDVNVWFNLSDGSIGANNGIASYTENIGNGWWRLVIQINTSDLSNLRFLPAASDAANSASGDYVYIQDAQLNYGLVAQTYQETTTAAVVSGITDNMPRLNYDPANPTCPSLLLEPSRTQLFTNDTYYGGSDWSKTTSGAASAPVVTTNYAVSPEGVQNASRVYFNAVGTSSADRSGLVQNFAFTTGQTYTISGYAKSATGTNQVLQFRVAGAQVGGELTATNEWQRFSVTHTATASTTDNFGIQLRGDNSANTSDLLLYGLQLELASYSSSLIPSYGSSATRTAEECKKTSVASLIGQTEGTLFLDFVPNSKDAADDFRLQVSDGSSSNWIFVGNVNSKLRGYVSGGVFDNSDTAVDIGTRYKLALSYSSTGASYYINGTLIEETTGTFTIPSTDQMSLQATWSATNQLISNVNQALLFKTRLSNSDLATLTTL